MTHLFIIFAPVVWEQWAEKYLALSEDIETILGFQKVCIVPFYLCCCQDSAYRVYFIIYVIKKLFN